MNESLSVEILWKGGVGGERGKGREEGEKEEERRLRGGVTSTAEIKAIINGLII
jgi:hypothetical protein